MSPLVEADSLHSERTERLSRSVVVNQLLFTAGYSLTAGGFLTFFAADLDARGKGIAWVLTLPELVGMLAVFTPALLYWIKNKKAIFLCFSILARGASLLIPIAALLGGSGHQLEILFTSIILTGIFQAISYTTYLSWLTELAPERCWGRFFARRNIAKAAVLVIVPFGGALLRDWFKTDLDNDQWKLFGYVVTFGIGNILQLVSLIPLLKWRVEPGGSSGSKAKTEQQIAEHAQRTQLKQVSTNPDSVRSLFFLIVFSWWLAFFQGLTQSAFYLHSIKTLHVSLTAFYLLSGSMYLVQMFFAGWAGSIGDRKGYRNLLFLSTFGVSFSLLFWVASINGDWFWLWGAYLVWGGFGAVNLSLQNLLFKIAPRGENTFPIAIRRYGAGLIAGATGLAGGYWLDHINETGGTVSLFWGNVNPFLLLFLVSFAGRLLAPLWLLGVKEHSGTDTSQ